MPKTNKNLITKEEALRIALEAVGTYREHQIYSLKYYEWDFFGKKQKELDRLNHDNNFRDHGYNEAKDEIRTALKRAFTQKEGKG